MSSYNRNKLQGYIYKEPPNTELKWFDSYKSDNIVTAPSPPTFWDNPVSNITQGKGETQRIGRKILIHSLQITGTFGATKSSKLAYFYIILDKQANQGDASEDQVFDIDGTGNGANTVFQNLYNSERFVFLHRQLFKVDFPYADAYPVYQPIDIFLDNLHIPLEYNLAGLLTSNNILVYIGQTAPVNGDCTLEYRSRARFYDYN